jgi:Copper binding periplasmic protein CusF
MDFEPQKASASRPTCAKGRHGLALRADEPTRAFIRCFKELFRSIAPGARHRLARPCHPKEDITKVDQSAGKITIKHGPIKKLGMDAGITVVFGAQGLAADSNRSLSTFEPVSVRGWEFRREKV